MRDFLVEIHTEELPPKSLKKLSEHFLKEIEFRLNENKLSYESAKYFATPRRLAVFVKKLAEKQEDSVIEKKGPALQAAYDQDGKPTPACIGFAKSCGIEPDQLITLKIAQGEYVGFKQAMKGKTVRELLPNIVNDALKALPIAKRMRWGESDIEFVRPVHSVIMLYGDKIISGTILGCEARRKTRGHRFLSKAWISIPSPAVYEEILETQCVIPDFLHRKKLIQHEIETIVQNTLGKNAVADLSDETLLDEVTGLVEWPVAICGNFDEAFLSVPEEALTSAMKDHQRYFPVKDKSGKLLPHFVAIINVKTKSPMHVVAGNERVLRARLSDAAFFYEVDKKTKLADKVPLLKNIVFQAKLGTLFDKTERLRSLSRFIAEKAQYDIALTDEAAHLSKADLVSQLVGEFPELQGIAGYYYATAEDAHHDVALALKEHYYPRFSGDAVPVSKPGRAVALADKIDTLVGTFGINQQPTGEKDPLGLRRAALGVLRILIECNMDLDLKSIIEKSYQDYLAHGFKLDNKDTVNEVLNFIFERLKSSYPADIFAAVHALNITNPYDFDKRAKAVQTFKNSIEANALSVANKRVSNILAKYVETLASYEINTQLFENDVESILSEKLTHLDQTIQQLSEKRNYEEVLEKLSHLRKPVDDYFDKVMVMTEDKAVRENRILLLKKLRESFLKVADIALLQ